MARRSVEIRLDSRYKDTGIVFHSALGTEGETFFEMWERPEELDALIEVSDQYLVRSVDVGRLDLLSYEFYGTEYLWWVIAAVNNIVDPIGDMFAGQRLYVPPYESVVGFMARAGNVVEETAG